MTPDSSLGGFCFYQNPPAIIRKKCEIGQSGPSERSSQVNKDLLTHVYAKVLKMADEAGMKAANECNEQMLQIQGYEPFPVCGFAWVNFKPATSHFTRWLKKRGHADKAYGGGLNLWVSKFGQSHDKKLAYARAYADVIQRELVLKGVVPGLTVYAGSRLD